MYLPEQFIIIGRNRLCPAVNRRVREGSGRRDEWKQEKLCQAVKSGREERKMALFGMMSRRLNGGLDMRAGKRLFTLALAACLTLTGILQGTPVRSKAAKATKQTDEYADNSYAEYFEKTMNQQLIACLSGSDGTKAKIESTSGSGFKSTIEFTFKYSKISGLNPNQILNYIEEAINDNPNFCTLSTATSTRWVSDKVYVKVKSVLKATKSTHATAIRKYKNFLANIEYIPREAKKMSDREILLYLHDRLIQQARYSLDTGNNAVFIPYTMCDTANVVCQSYAAVLNHLMRDLGFTSYAVWSTSHAWNVVKLDGVWTNIDATWDDPVKRYYDYVMHDYFLCPLSAFKDSHDLSVFMKARFPGLATSATNDFGVLPKTNKVEVPVCYRTGVWFYAKGGRVYRWDGTSAAGTVESAIPQDANRCVNVLNHTVFVGGSDGLYTYSVEDGTLKKIADNIKVEGLLYFDRTLYYRTGSSWNKIVTYESSATYESLNGTSNAEKYKLVKPGKPTIVAKKSSSKSIRVAVSKAAKNANAGYQVQISTDSSFKNKKSKTISGTRVNIVGLTAGRTYYVRVRGIWKSRYFKKYGKWSKIKKG